MTNDELRRRLGLDPDYDLMQWRLLYANATHEPLRIYLGDFRWTVFTVARALEYGEQLAGEVLHG
jgi:hypothetical protein